MSTSRPRHTDPVDSRPGGVGLLMAVLLTACIAFQLNASMLAPVLATMAAELGTDEATVGLSQTAFFTAGAMCGLFLPRLSDIVGRRKILLIMLTVMAIGGVIAAVAPSIELLLIGRAIQGIAGPTIPLTLLMLRSQVHDSVRLGTLMGIIAAVNGGIAGIDVLLSGWMATAFGFRSVFWLIAIVGFIAAAVVAWRGPESKPSSNVRMDWIGAGILVISVLSITLAVNEAGSGAQANFLLAGGLAVFGLLVFVGFWQWESHRAAQPLVEPRYLKRRSTWALLLTTVLTMAGIFAAVNGVAISLAQNEAAGFGLRADFASLVMLTPYALIGWAVGPFAGRYAPIIGYGRLLRIGLGASAAVLLGLAFLGVQHQGLLIAGVIALGITYAGIVNIVLNNLGVVNSPADNEGFLPGMNSAAFNLGAGISFAVLPVVMVAGSPQGSDSTAGYTMAFLVAVAIIAAAFITSLLIPRPVNAEVTEDALAATESTDTAPSSPSAPA